MIFSWKSVYGDEHCSCSTGQGEFDSESGLYYYRARYYSPELGRFISRDPIDVEDQINLYGYVGNNPVMYVDPMGLAKALIIVGLDIDGEYPEFEDGPIKLKEGNAYIASMFNIQGKYLYKEGVDFDVRVVTNATEFDKAIKEKKRKMILFIGHGSEDGKKLFMNLKTGEGITKEDLKNNSLGNSCSDLNDTTMYIYSCHAGDNEVTNNEPIGKSLEEYYKFNLVKAPSKSIRSSDDGKSEYIGEKQYLPSTDLVWYIYKKDGKRNYFTK